MNDYEAKLEAKRARFLELAEKHEELSADKFKYVHRMTQLMSGQPVLIGHYSQKRHEKDLERMHNAMRKSIEHDKIAAYYRKRAASVGTGGISSDDPDAINKVVEKLEGLVLWHETMIQANKALRKVYGRNLRNPDKARDAHFVKKASEVLEAVGLTRKEAIRRAVPGASYPYQTGYATYSISNSNQNIKATRDRLDQLMKIEEVANSDQKTEWEVNGCTVELAAEDNRIRIYFQGKPTKEFMRTVLKRNGYRWSRYNGAWQCFYGGYDSRVQKAKEIAQAVEY